jgi:uncharacterized RDD family membrane protein YckC
MTEAKLEQKVFMNWYYVTQGNQTGPCSDEELQKLRATGVITRDTLVWHDGLAEWKPLGEVKPESGTTPSALTGAGVAQAACCECGRSLPQSEMIQFENKWVCAACKPQFLQKMKEGVTLSGHLEYAGFGIRVGARLVDTIILVILNLVIGLLVRLVLPMPTSGANGDFSGVLIPQIILLIIQVAVNAGYMIYFIGNKGATPGKMACGLKVVSGSGGKVSYGKATGRYFADMLNGFTLGIGYLLVIWDPEKRALHDRLCDTRVIRG